jgi:ketosteroid isomerase-like protein
VHSVTPVVRGLLHPLARRRDSCDDLNVKTLAAFLLFAAVSALGVDCPKNQPKTETALISLENTWADALTRKDADAVACILAGEFEDADVDGSVHSRAEALAKIPNRRPGTNRLSQMRAHVESNMGYARGLAELVGPDGVVKARVRFTDIFAYRDGRWQALAGQETLLGEASR